MPVGIFRARQASTRSFDRACSRACIVACVLRFLCSQLQPCRPCVLANGAVHVVGGGGEHTHDSITGELYHEWR